MKKYRSPFALLVCVSLLSSACTKRISMQVMHLGKDQICNASLAAQPEQCLPVDGQHAVVISIRDGAPHLQALSVAHLVGAPGNLRHLADHLKRQGLAQAIDPVDTEVQVIDGDWVFASKSADAPPRITLEKDRMRHAKGLLLNDGDGWVLTTMTAAPRLAAIAPQTSIARDLTDSIKISKGRTCPLRLEVEGTKVTAFFGIGVAEVLDDGIGGINQRRGDAGAGVEGWLKSLNSRTGNDLAFAHPAGHATPHPFSLTALAAPGAGNDKVLGAMVAGQTCMCNTTGRRVIYKDHALFFDDGKVLELWVDLKDMNCTFCLDRFNGMFRITTSKLGCESAFNCAALTGCFVE
jgi:hypothetical protein